MTINFSTVWIQSPCFLWQRQWFVSSFFFFWASERLHFPASLLWDWVLANALGAEVTCVTFSLKQLRVCVPYFCSPFPFHWDCKVRVFWRCQHLKTEELLSHNLWNQQRGPSNTNVYVIWATNKQRSLFKSLPQLYIYLKTKCKIYLSRSWPLQLCIWHFTLFAIQSNTTLSGKVFHSMALPYIFI